MSIFLRHKNMPERFMSGGCVYTKSLAHPKKWHVRTPEGDTHYWPKYIARLAFKQANSAV